MPDITVKIEVAPFWMLSFPPPGPGDVTALERQIVADLAIEAADEMPIGAFCYRSRTDAVQVVLEMMKRRPDVGTIWVCGSED